MNIWLIPFQENPVEYMLVAAQSESEAREIMDRLGCAASRDEWLPLQTGFGVPIQTYRWNEEALPEPIQYHEASEIQDELNVVPRLGPEKAVYGQFPHLTGVEEYLEERVLDHDESYERYVVQAEGYLTFWPRETLDYSLSGEASSSALSPENVQVVAYVELEPPYHEARVLCEIKDLLECDGVPLGSSSRTPGDWSDEQRREFHDGIDHSELPNPYADAKEEHRGDSP